MGLLDDAIREHLELKRRAGADPADVARLEREAFGAQEQAADNGGAQAAPPAVSEVDELRPDPGGHVDVSDAPHPDEHVHEPAAVGDALVDPEPLAHEPLAHEPAAPEPAAPERESVEQPTRQFTAAELEDAQRPQRASEEPDLQDEELEEHDELEETPDFLQETPEHDRLWFEQKPPRDFDF